MVKKGRTDAAAGGEPVLTVTAQQSRYQTDAETSTAVKEIVVKDFTITLGNRDLLSHAELYLHPGRHYVLSGRNGTGKSTLLRALATAQVPNIPQSTRVLLLSQVQSDEADATTPENETVIQHVVRSDKQREILLQESRTLSTAADDVDDPEGLVRAYRQLQHARLERELVNTRRIAERRSGARGKEARKELILQEEALEVSMARLDDLRLSDDQATEIQQAYDMLAMVQSTLEVMQSSSAEAKARAVLLGLGFAIASLDQPMSNLSGGWQTRCRLACALCQSADLLLLDEPTNGLDLPSIIWLENYLKNLEPSTTLIVVTHDRMFADAVGDELLILREQKIERFRGSLSGYELARMKKYKHLDRMKNAQEKQKKHMQDSVANAHTAARRTGDDKKLKQAASRQKKLDERMGIEVSAKGTRFKLNRDLAGYYLTKRDGIELPTFDPPPSMTFATSPADLRSAGALVSLENVTFSYQAPGRTRPVLQDISLTIHLGDRVGLAGLNGSGKTTLVRLAMGVLPDSAVASGQLASGNVTRQTRARLGLYSQRSVEELNEIASGRPELTPMTHLHEVTGSGLSEQEVRGVLSSLGLAGKVASDVPIALLSGGQKVRLALAKLLWNPPHLLVLDEVTTHLDADSIHALATALKRYKGAILLATHDRFFMRCVVEGESPRKLARESQLEGAGHDDDDDSDSESDAGDQTGDEAARRPGVVYSLRQGKLLKLEGGMQEYERKAEKMSSRLGLT